MKEIIKGAHYTLHLNRKHYKVIAGQTIPDMRKVRVYALLSNGKRSKKCQYVSPNALRHLPKQSFYSAWNRWVALSREFNFSYEELHAYGAPSECRGDVNRYLNKSIRIFETETGWSEEDLLSFAAKLTTPKWIYQNGFIVTVELCGQFLAIQEGI